MCKLWYLIFGESEMSKTELKQNPETSLTEHSKGVKVDSIETDIKKEPMHVKNLAELSEAMSALKDKVVFLDFFANWCGPCRIIAPKLKEFQQNYSNVAVLKVDVDEAEDLFEQYNITVLPTFVALKGGDQVEMLTGADVSKLENLFKKYN